MFVIETFTGPKAQAKITQMNSSIISMDKTDIMRFLLLNLAPDSQIAGI